MKSFILGLLVVLFINGCNNATDSVIVDESEDTSIILDTNLTVESNTHLDDGKSCDDGDAQTANDVYLDGECVGTPTNILDLAKLDETLNLLTFELIRATNLVETDITDSLFLVTSLNGVDIVWSSSNLNSISTEGIVSSGIIEQKVILTATLNYNNSSVTKSFSLSVAENPALSALEVAKNLLTFDLIKNLNLLEAEIETDLNLMDTINDVNLTWSSSATGTISNTGVVTLGLNDVHVTLIATLSKDGFSMTKEFNLLVLQDIDLIIENANNLLTFLIIKNKNILESDIKSNLSLPTTFENTNISWSSSNQSFLSNSGVVNIACIDTNVTLTASISKTGGTTLVKEFMLVVTAQSDIDIVNNAISSLSFGLIGGDNKRKEDITSDLNLSIATLSCANVSWNFPLGTGPIDVNGTIGDLDLFWSAANAAGLKNQLEMVELNATISKNLETQSKSFFVYFRQPLIATELKTLIVVVNSTDYFETDATIWHDKFFSETTDSVNKYYSDNTDAQYKLIPVNEAQGTLNDGVIFINTNAVHPGDILQTDPLPYITSYIEKVDSYIDFSAYTTDSYLSVDELNIIFIMSGGESSYGDPQDHSVWAHAYGFNNNPPVLDGISIFQASRYAIFGANHSLHKATIGVIVHELGHSIFNLSDYYDIDGGSSGLSTLDVMSAGSWSLDISSDLYAGETPTGFSAVNKYEMNTLLFDKEVLHSGDTSINDVNQNEFEKNIYTIACDNESVRIKDNTQTQDDREFIIECRDTLNKYNKSFVYDYDSAFGDGSMFLNIYHYNDDVFANYANGDQTLANHYRAALVEKDTSSLFTHTAGLSTNVGDSYFVGDIIAEDRFKFLNNMDVADRGAFSIEVLSEDTIGRTMTFKVNYTQ